MVIYITSAVNQSVWCRVDNGDYFELHSNVKSCVNCNSSESVRVMLSPQHSSHFKKGGVLTTNRFYLALQSDYYFNQVIDGAEFVITGKQSQISYKPIYYDRLFISSLDAILISEHHVVTEAEALKASYAKGIRAQRHNVLAEPFYVMLTRPLSALIIIAGIVGFAVAFSWWVALLVFAGFYLISVLFALLAHSVFGVLLDKLVRKILHEAKSEMADFEQYLTNDYIIRFYSSSGQV